MKEKWVKIIKKYYNNEAITYDSQHLYPKSAALYVEKRRRVCILPMVNRTGKILDVACGTGYYLQLFSNNECVGSDISERMIKRCKKKGIKNVLVGNYEKLPFKDNIFNIVLCINSFQYTKNPEKVLHEMNRVSKENGEIIFTYFNLLNPRTVVHLIKDILGKKINIEQRYMIFAIRKMLNNAGLKIVESYGCNFLLCPINGKKRNGAVLKAFEIFEKKIRRTPLKHFANEIVLRLKE